MARRSVRRSPRPVPEAGLTEQVLSQALAGQANAYDWLARSVGSRAGVVLDVGCGAGAMSRALAMPGRTVIGIDIAEHELQQAREHSPGPWVMGDARHLPFADHSIDTVVTVMGLAVIRPADELLAEISRVLRPGGMLAAIAPSWRPFNSSDLSVNARLLARLQSRASLRHAATGASQRTSPAGLGRLLGRHGLRKVEDKRERYYFTVRTPRDAELLVRGLAVHSVRSARTESAVAWLAGQAERSGELQVPIPMRRVIAFA